MSLYWLCSREGDFSGQNEIFLRNVTKAVMSGAINTQKLRHYKKRRITPASIQYVYENQKPNKPFSSEAFFI